MLLVALHQRHPFHTVRPAVKNLLVTMFKTKPRFVFALETPQAHTVFFLCARCFRGSMLASSSDTVQVQGGRGNLYLDLDPATPAPWGRAVAPARPELLHCRLPDADARRAHPATTWLVGKASPSPPAGHRAR